MTSHTRRVLELGVGLGLALTLVLTALADWHQRTAARVRADTIRLHILANSDTWDDQLLKLQVRDAVLAAIPEAVTRADTPQQAAAALQTALPALQNAADNALHRAHSAQPARLRLERFAFAARDYGGFALPGGEYTALRIELGAAGAATGSASSTRLSASPAHSLTTPRKRKTRWCLEDMRCDGR